MVEGCACPPLPFMPPDSPLVPPVRVPPVGDADEPPEPDVEPPLVEVVWPPELSLEALSESEHPQKARPIQITSLIGCIKPESPELIKY